MRCLLIMVLETTDCYTFKSPSLLQDSITSLGIYPLPEVHHIWDSLITTRQMLIFAKAKGAIIIVTP